MEMPLCRDPSEWDLLIFAGQQIKVNIFEAMWTIQEEFTPIAAQWVYNYVYDANRPINFWLNMKDPLIRTADSILPLWCPGRCSLSRRDGATTRIDGAEPVT